MSLLVNIRKDFGSFKLSCNFQSEDGIVGFLGASGSGKSLTLQCIAGIITPDEGKIILDGVTLFDHERGINLPPQKRRVGYLFQHYALFPNMTVAKNIEVGAHRIKDAKKRRETVERLLSEMQLWEVRNHRIWQISGGQQQRCALARILANEPDILLLDEPFSALDAYLREILITQMKRWLQDYGKDVILVSHSRDEVYQLCDQVAIIVDGKVDAMGETKAVFAGPQTVGGALLTGCKNIAKATKTGEHEVFVPAWNVHLKTKEAVGDDVSAVGIRAHYFHPQTQVNAYEVELVEEIEEPFAWIIKFRYRNSDEVLWWRLSKEKKPQSFPARLGIAPANVMLLYEK